MALCFNCGDIKHGAICPCPKCQVKSSGNMQLDIEFSDHNYDVETLREFGGVIRAINSATTEPPIRFWAFIHYVSEHHPSILNTELRPEILAQVTEVLRGVALPPVTIRGAPIMSLRLKLRGRESDDDA
jgi:hypothetical protein